MRDLFSATHFSHSKTYDNLVKIMAGLVGANNVRVARSVARVEVALGARDGQTNGSREGGLNLLDCVEKK